MGSRASLSGFFLPAGDQSPTATACLLAEFNPAKAKALLDTYGYVERDGNGYREASRRGGASSAMTARSSRSGGNRPCASTRS